jgi:CBS domain-containing protein
MPVPDALVDSVVRFLGAHAPFAQMAAADLRFLSEHLALAYFPAQAVIVETSAADAAPLHIVQRGHVRFEPSAGEGVVLGPGECFPLQAGGTLAGAPGRFVATEDVFCYLLEGPPMRTLQGRSPAFRDYCIASVQSLNRDSQSRLHREFMDRAIEQSTLLEPLAALVRRAPVSCSRHTPVLEALEHMSRASVGTIAVVDPGGKPVGIFTLTDLMERIALRGKPLSTPVEAVMTAAPDSLDEQACAQDAMAVMAARGVHQLLVTRDGVLAGVISERDLFALQRVSIRNVQQRIRAAVDEAMLRTAAAELGRLTDNLLAQGIGSEPLTRIISAMNDTLSCRVIELTVPRFNPGPQRWCWLALGSEGRREQTVVSDQDNALLFADGDGDDEADRARRADAARARLVPFADAVNEALARLGFPLCPGQIMAGNPRWCLSGAEWRTRFDSWMREPTPDALLHANIFFDFRPLCGELTLGLELRSWLTARAAGARLFLALMTANALQCEPPLGLMRMFHTDEGAAGTLDLKTHGTRLFVDAARVLALASGIAETHTTQRLRQGARALNLPERDLAGFSQAFEFVQLLRLRAQRGILYPAGAEVGPPAGSNRIDPYALSDPDQRLLRESFRQARELQLLLARSVAH